MNKLLIQTLVFISALAATAVFAGEEAGSKSKVQKKKIVESGKALRVGGTYTVQEINKNDDRDFTIVFVSTAPSGRFDELRLDSDHVHVAVREGQEVRLSAEILQEKGSKADVAQVVLFLNGRVGRTPVWLLSNKAKHADLRGARYLEMHVPLNDYFVL